MKMLIILLWGALASQQSFCETIYPQQLLSTSTLIELQTRDRAILGWGSGFYLKHSNKTFLVTADHVLFDQTASPFLNSSDFTDLRSLRSSLIHASAGQFPDFILQRLSPSTRAILSASDTNLDFQIQFKLMTQLMAELNRLMASDQFLDPARQRLVGLKLSRQTAGLCNANPTNGPALILLNRMLFQDAFPGAISKRFLFARGGELRAPLMFLRSHSQPDATGKVTPIQTVFDAQWMLDNGLISRHPAHDVCAVQLGTDAGTNGEYSYPLVCVITNFQPGEGRTVIGIPQCTMFKDVAAGQQTVTLGYPISLDPGSWVLDFDEPVTLVGAVAQRNKKTQRLIVSSFVYQGNSGGPVFAVSHPSSLLK